jgi:hypothetical protein
MDKRRKVRFAQNNDVFVLPFVGEDSLRLDGSSQMSQLEIECDDDAGEASTYAASVLDTRERMRDCIVAWSQTPCWKLLEGSVDDDDGEAKDVQKYIVCFARIEVDGDCPRGLERQLCRSHHEARKELQENATQAVLSLDFRLRTEYNSKKDDDIWKEIRQISKEHSRGAKAFARKMGKADEAAVHRDPVDIGKAMAYIEDLQQRAQNGSLRFKRVSTSDSKRRSGSNTASTLPSSRSERAFDPLGQYSEHSNKDSKTKKDRKAPVRIPSMTITHRHAKPKESRTKNDIATVSEDTNTDHTADHLFHDVDKKGKTKRSSRWKSLKKGISKRVHAGGSHRTQ